MWTFFISISVASRTQIKLSEEKIGQSHTTIVTLVKFPKLRQRMRQLNSSFGGGEGVYDIFQQGLILHYDIKA